ncbi:MAG: hypothetical protein H5T33_07640 [Candidatus Methanosuratus sp.]|nr:hypothetical protein [Candidatus Methanosuratincola sp.]
MARELRQKVEFVIDRTKQYFQDPDAPSFLPYILSWLQEVAEELGKSEPNREMLMGLARAIGRGVTDDYQFSESPVGTAILEIVSDIVHYYESQSHNDKSSK